MKSGLSVSRMAVDLAAAQLSRGRPMTVAERRIAVIAMGSRLTNFNLYSIYFLQPRPTHTPVDRRRSVVSSRRSSCSEQSSTSCHVCSVSDCIPKSPEDLSLQSLFLMTTLYHIFVVPAQRLFVISDTLIVLFTYLLTYLLTCSVDNFSSCIYFTIHSKHVENARHGERRK